VKAVMRVVFVRPRSANASSISLCGCSTAAMTPLILRGARVSAVATPIGAS
jgi:hypothetical protein